MSTKMQMLHLALIGWTLSCCCVWTWRSEAACLPVKGCDAMAHYVAHYVTSRVVTDVLYDIALRFGTNYPFLQRLNGISNPENLLAGQALWIPFHCDCGNGQLGHNFSYSVSRNYQTDTIASTQYGNLTRAAWIDALNANPNNLLPNQVLTIPINCSCGDPQVSKDYGFFGTYVAQPNDTLASISQNFSVPQDLLGKYNPTVRFDQLQSYVSIIFFPVKNSSDMYPPLDSSLITADGSHVKGYILGAVVGGICAFLAMAAFGIWFFCFRTSKKHGKSNSKDKNQKPLMMDQSSTEFSGLEKQSGLTNGASFGGASSGFGPLSKDSVIEFSYEELAAVTENFSVAKEIGRGGFATVYYGEYQGERLAIKKMDVEETKGFINELRVLTSVHHTNLVRLVGYCCTKTFLFLVYEYIEKGSLAHHLRLGKDGTQIQVLSWEKRVQIALDAARGIEYLHDHTTPTYVHRDIKPANILLDKDYNAKVGDFGLTKFTDPEGMLLTDTMQGGTYGYLAPEYAQFGLMSSKADVYAFGVVLFQIVSGKDAIVDVANGDRKQVVSLFEGVLNEPDAVEKLHPLVDPALQSNYPVEAVWKMVTLAERCTRKKSELRPLMREVVLELTTISQLNQGVQAYSYGGNDPFSTVTVSN